MQAVLNPVWDGMKVLETGSTCFRPNKTNLEAL